MKMAKPKISEDKLEVKPSYMRKAIRIHQEKGKIFASIEDMIKELEN